MIFIHCITLALREFISFDLTRLDFFAHLLCDPIGSRILIKKDETEVKSTRDQDELERMHRKLKCEYDTPSVKMSQIQAELSRQSTPFEWIIKTKHFEEPVNKPLNDCEKLNSEVQSDDYTPQTRDVASNRILQLAKKLSELKGKCARLIGTRNWFST
jgi:hypothetical protein